MTTVAFVGLQRERALPWSTLKRASRQEPACKGSLMWQPELSDACER